MKNEFKVGDAVAVYTGSTIHRGIINARAGDMLRLEGMENVFWHYKQCRLIGKQETTGPVPDAVFETKNEFKKGDHIIIYDQSEIHQGTVYGVSSGNDAVRLGADTPWYFFQQCGFIEKGKE